MEKGTLKIKDDILKDKIKILLPFAVLTIFIVIVWPWADKTERKAEPIAKKASSSVEQAKARTPQRSGNPDFKPEVVKTQESKEKKAFFRVTAPEAIVYAENDRLAYEQGPGQTPLITDEQIKESKQLQSTIEATKDPEQFGSRLSPLVKAAPFDKARFKTDKSYKEKYLSVAEPSRVYQTDGDSEVKIKRVTPYYQEVMQGQSITISVQAEANMPVSINSFDLGKFGNHLTCQTVLADASGVASFEYFGVEGTFNDSNLLVSSPTTRGHVKFVVHTKIKTIKEN